MILLQTFTYKNILNELSLENVHSKIISIQEVQKTQPIFSLFFWNIKQNTTNSKYCSRLHITFVVNVNVLQDDDQKVTEKQWKPIELLIAIKNAISGLWIIKQTKWNITSSFFIITWSSKKYDQLQNVYLTASY